MNIWEWIRDFRHQAEKIGDRDRLRLTEFHPRAYYTFGEADPDQALALYEQGRNLALRLNEPGWVLFFDDWRVSTLLWFKRDYRNVLDLAVRNALEARRPEHEHVPLRFIVRRNLICAYQLIDPLGYADRIKAALDELEADFEMVGEEKYLVQDCRMWLDFELGDLDSAQERALRVLTWAEKDAEDFDAAHYAIYACTLLCQVAWQRRDDASIRLWAEAGQELITGTDHKMERCEFSLWQALVARREGREKEARSLCRVAQTQAGRLGMPPSRGYFDPLCAYHLAGDQPERALETRRRERALIAGRGQLADECRNQVEICRLLAQMNLPLQAELQRAYECAARLRAPARYLTDLQAIARTTA